MQARRLNGADAAQWRALRLEALVTAPKAFLTTYAEAEASIPLAIAFYTRHSFVEAGRLPNAVVTEDVPETDILMVYTRR